MSKSFIYNIKYLSKNLEINLVAGTAIFTIGSFCHGCYTYGTTKNNIITINKKYTFTRNGVTEFMIIDNNNKHYMLIIQFGFGNGILLKIGII